MFTASHLDLGVAILQKAIDADRQHNYGEAYKLYQKSLDYLRLALTYERDQQAKVLILEKIKECVARSETLKGFMIDQSSLRTPQSVTSATSSDSTTEDGEVASGKGTRYRDWALETVKKAIDEDQKQNYGEAYRLYQNSIDYFRLALDHERSERGKMVMRKKMNEYFTRSQMLKDYLAGSSGGRSGGVHAPGRAGGEPSCISASAKNHVDRGIDIVKKAIEEDHRKNYAEAYKLYQESLDNFRLALKYERNEKAKDIIRTKMNEYFARVEKLKGRSNK